jgi:hypothetical protein
MRSSKCPIQEFFKVNISQNYFKSYGHDPMKLLGHDRMRENQSKYFLNLRNEFLTIFNVKKNLYRNSSDVNRPTIKCGGYSDR